jgi:hypothetical protein
MTLNDLDLDSEDVLGQINFLMKNKFLDFENFSEIFGAP